MRSKFTIEIPYFSRSKYKDFINLVNETVEESGCCIFFISNIVPHLKSYLVVETNDCGLQIESFIKENGLSNDTSKSLDEFYVEMQTRQWDCCTLRKSENTDFLFDLYAFNEEDVLETKGYKWKPARKQKLFISYCHNDANVVHEIVNSIQRAGIHVWIDTEEIDAGDSLIEEISKGIYECDLHIVFISQSTITAQFASFELKTIWNRLIRSSGKWFIIRLDDTDPESIYTGLGQYKYIDYRSSDDLVNIIKEIMRKLKKKNV